MWKFLQIDLNYSMGIMCKVCAAICAKSMKLGTLTNYNMQIILSLRPSLNLPQGGGLSIATGPAAMATNFFPPQIQNT